jgi:hypothetical protein
MSKNLVASLVLCLISTVITSANAWQIDLAKVVRYAVVSHRAHWSDMGRW